MNFQNNIKLAVSTLILAGVFGGCVEPKLSTTTRSNFIDLTNEDKSHTDIQNGIYSLSGLLSVPKLGFTYFHTEKRKPFYQIGYGGKHSYYMSQTIDGNTSSETISSIRANLLDLRATAINDIKTNIKKYSYDNNSTKLVLTDNDTVISFNKKYAEIVNSIKKEGLFVLSWSKKIQENSKESADISIFDTKHNKRDSLNSNGFMILNGLKISTLFIGSDILSHWDNINDDINTKEKTYPRIVSTTIQSKAVYFLSEINYDQEIQNIINIKLLELSSKFPNKNKKDIKKQLEEIVKLEKEYYYNKISSINSLGITSKMQKSAKRLFFTDTSDETTNYISTVNSYINDEQNTTLETTSNWQTIYSVDTDIFKLKNWIKKIDGNTTITE